MSVYFIVLVALVVLMALVPYNSGQAYIDNDDPLRVVPTRQNGYVHGSTCGENGPLNIIIVATLNGGVTALAGDTGCLLWSHSDAPLLQGTLSNVEPIDIGGTSLQLMPTLDGRLFSYSERYNLIEPLPITTDSLLESTIRLGQDAVAGGKSVTTKGVDLFTGETKYECSIDSCGNASSQLPENPILLLKRITNSIRAMDTLRGIERWNLSTSELDVSLAGIIPTKTVQPSDFKFLLQPPDGVVVAVDANNHEGWKMEVEGHIVNVWHVTGNGVEEISLFDPTNIYTTRFEVMHHMPNKLERQSSLLYMGLSDGTPFIIQSPKAKQNLKKRMNSLPEVKAMTEIQNPSYCSATGAPRGISYQVEDTALLVVLRNAMGGQNHQKAIEDQSTAKKGKMQIVPPTDDPFAQKVAVENLKPTSLFKRRGDEGYLLFETQKRTPRYKVPSPMNVVHTIFTYVMNPTSLVCLLTGFVGFATAIVYNQVQRRAGRIEAGDRRNKDSTESDISTQLTRSTGSSPADDECETAVGDGSTDSTSSVRSLMAKANRIPVEKSNIELCTSPPVKPKKRQVKTDVDTDEGSFDDIEQKKRLARNRTISRSSLEGFTSRFANEFEVKKVIGHGGFGVVFRAQSITDMNEYAVKRIAVADNDKARDRVLREARALAMFDHPAIIRYFYAWEERPPKGYQEKEDENLLGKIRADKLAKLHKTKKDRKSASQAHNVKSADSFLSGETFEMPPVVGNTMDDSWSADVKPEEIGKQRTTSESKRGLHGESDTTAEVGKEKSVRFSSSDEESDTTETSSSNESSSSSSSFSADNGPKRSNVYSSSGGIEFVNDSEEIQKGEENKGSDNDQDKPVSFHNRAMIVETENQELEVRETDDTRECAYLYIVMQLCAERTLEDWIKRNKTAESRSLPVIKDWIKQLASGLDYLHNKGFIHRDLKPGNVFFSLDSKPDHQILKIGDLGLATKTDGTPRVAMHQDTDSDAKHTKNVGTRSYMSPEQLGHQQYTEKVDIFALGLVATELLVPFSTAMERIRSFGDFQSGVAPSILENYPFEMRDFLLSLTSFDPSGRPSATEVTSHPFLQ